jgi:DNA-binding NarL/FixJ family response regulator
MTCNEDQLLAACGGNEVLFDRVMQERAKANAAAQAARPKPDPPRPSREDLTADVLRLHREGKAVAQIAEATGLGRTLVVYLIDQHAK